MVAQLPVANTPVTVDIPAAFLPAYASVLEEFLGDTMFRSEGIGLTR